MAKRLVIGLSALGHKTKNIICLGSQYRRFAVSGNAAPYTPRRALMYVPADDERKLRKIDTLKTDCVVLDCEDGVAVNRKEEARNGAVRFLEEKAKQKGRYGEIGVRVNSLSSNFLEDDFKALSQVQHCIQALMVPKLDSVDDVRLVWGLFTKYCNSIRHPVNLVVWIESARALIDMPQILLASEQLLEHCPLRLEGAVLGSDDLCADLGATRSKEGTEIAYARQKFLLVCKAFRIQAIDCVYIDYKDLDGLRVQCEEAQKMGFTGKQVIHPTQVPVAQKAFLPSPEKVHWARELMQEFALHQKSGKGAFAFKGQMIDMPLVLQARNIVELVERIKEVEEKSD